MKTTISEANALILIASEDFDRIVRLRMLSEKTKQTLEDKGIYTIIDFKQMSESFIDNLDVPADEIDAIKTVQAFLLNN